MYTNLLELLLNDFPNSGCTAIKKTKRYVYSLFLYLRNKYFILMFIYFEIIFVIKLYSHIINIILKVHLTFKQHLLICLQICI